MKSFKFRVGQTLKVCEVSQNYHGIFKVNATVIKRTENYVTLKITSDGIDWLGRFNDEGETKRFKIHSCKMYDAAEVEFVTYRNFYEHESEDIYSVDIKKINAIPCLKEAISSAQWKLRQKQAEILDLQNYLADCQAQLAAILG